MVSKTCASRLVGLADKQIRVQRGVNLNLTGSAEQREVACRLSFSL
jgi:hypothetical protein